MYILTLISPWACEWDPAKAETNLAKHGISFVTAATVLARGTAFLDQLHFDSRRLVH